MNSLAYFRHKFLRLPVKMSVTYDNHVENPFFTLVFLHGIATDSRTWKATIKELSPNFKNCRFISLDLLGHGKSPAYSWLDYDYLDYETSLKSTLKPIIGPIILVGHSMGALIAAKYATHANDTRIKHLILVSPPVIMPSELQKPIDKLYVKSYDALPSASEKPAVITFLSALQKISSFQRKYLTTPQFDRAMHNIILNPTNYETFANLKIPSTIIHGQFDPLVVKTNLKKVAAHNKNTKLLVCGLSHHDITAQKRAKIRKTLEKLV